MASPQGADSIEPNSDTHFIVDSSGDVILHVGSEDSYSIQVSSKVLSVASDVFAAMFSGRFQEGRELRANQLAKGQPLSIDFPDDEKEAMLMCCYILHFRIDSSSSIPGQQALVNLAILADKYNCTRALWPLSDHWIDSHIEDATKEGLGRLLLVSYLLGTSGMFEKVTKSLTEISNEDLSKLATGPEYDVLPLSIYVGLAECKSMLRSKVEKALSTPYNIMQNATHDNSQRCDYRRDHCLASYVSALFNAGLWPLPSTITIPQLRLSLRKCIVNAHQPCKQCQEKFKSAIQEIQTKVSVWAEGLCLGCVNSIPHDQCFAAEAN